MAARKDTEPGAAAPEPGAPVSDAAIIDALAAASPETLRAIMQRAGIAPTTIGMTSEHLQALLGTLGATSATAMREAVRAQRKENPNYPERSVFNPGGVFDDDGKPREPKVKFRRPTFFQGVRLGGELETAEEITLCNRFTESRYSREGKWKAEIDGQGIHARLVIDVPSNSVDDRMALPPFTHILRELLDGSEAVNVDTMAKRIDDLEAEIRSLRGARAGR